MRSIRPVIYTATMAPRGPRAPVVMPTDSAVLAYAAGIIDGEGNITVLRRRKSGTDSIYHTHGVRVTSADKCLVDWLAGHFGGHIGVTAPRDGQRFDVHRWALTSRRATPFLASIQPYLVIKKRQAAVALALAATKVRDGTGTRPWVTDEMFVHRESLRQQMLALNRREVPLP